MSSMTERKKERLAWLSLQSRKDAYPSKEQEEKHLKSLAKLHLEFSHLRACKDLGLTNETAIHWSDTYGKYILCGISYVTLTRKGDQLRLEVLHHELDWFRIVVICTSRYLMQKSITFDCTIRFKHLVKFIAFLIPILKDD